MAQISNTLLKQFSYNEIHNRRVALGITCVQCTPVQLEILRRAGAMPVSSRRCGMITRREAERLCKSFLGDNAPPRLPDDFAFSVHHKCAWGCHGSFLPARYNSSRAKCIKCSYCGLFFSPNKFIFHSHRISASDKYVQPDAANFNSWRRHMTLSGHSPEEIIHAWEDVKAMFNGGTRKRLMSHSSASVVNRAQHSKLTESISSSAADVIGLGVMGEERHCDVTRQSPSKRSKESGSSIGAVTAAAVVGVTAVAAAVGAVSQQLPIRPFNIHSPTAVQLPASGLSCESASGGLHSTANEISIMPFSRSFMMDYMWHAHAVQSATQLQQQQHQKYNGGNAEAFGFPNCSFPWIKHTNGSNGSLLLGASCAAAGAELPTQISSVDSNSLKQTPSSYDAAESSPAAIVASASQIAGIKIFREPAAFLKSSAFKPVVQHHHQQQQLQQQIRPLTAENTATAASSMLKANATTATLVSTSVYTSTAAVAAALSSTLSSSSSSSSSSNCSSSSTLSLTNAAAVVKAPAIALTRLLPPPTIPPALLTIPTESLKTTTTLTVSAATATSTKLPAINSGIRYRRTPTPEKAAASKLSATTTSCFPLTSFIKESQSSEEDEVEEAEDDELVDIETTEDDHLLTLQYYHHQQVVQRSPTPPRQKFFCLPTVGQLTFSCQRKLERCNSMDEIVVDGDDDDSDSTCNVDTDTLSVHAVKVPVKLTVKQQAAFEESAGVAQLCNKATPKRNCHDSEIERHLPTTGRLSAIEIVENSNESICEVLSRSEEDEEPLPKNEVSINVYMFTLFSLT